MRFVEVKHGLHTNVMDGIVEIIVRVDKSNSRFEFECINAHIGRIIGIKCTTWVMDAIFISIDAEFMSVIITPPPGNPKDKVKLSQRSGP